MTRYKEGRAASMLTSVTETGALNCLLPVVGINNVYAWLLVLLICSTGSVHI